MTARPGPPARRRRAARRLAWLAVALLPALVARLALRPYEVDSPSMEPALRVGDRLLAVADAVDPRPRAPWDVAFFDRALDPSVPAGVSAVVKRVVSWGDEFVAVRDGDVWAGPGRDRLALRAKPDALVAALLVPVHAADGLAPPWTGAGLQGDRPTTRLEADGGPRLLRFGATIEDGSAGAGSVELDGSSAVHDTALRVVLGEGDADLVLQLRAGAHTFGAELGAAGGARLHHNLGGGAVADDPSWPGLAAGQTVLFWHVDGRLRLFVDDALVLAHELDPAAAAAPRTGRHNEPSLGVVGGARQFRRVEVLRDVHYTPDGEHGTRPGGPTTPARVPPGHAFLLGDQSQASRDSRHFGAVPLQTLLGRPVLRYGPAGRRAWLGADGAP